jgi:tetratricopeptide (TPR) repeat protein
VKASRRIFLFLLSVGLWTAAVTGVNGSQPAGAADQAESTGVAPDRLSPAGLQSAFEEGNRLYGEGDYEGAASAYSKLVDSGVVNQDLFYNLGNACYKNEELGRAVLYYERALRLSPRNRDIRENLAHVESMLRDRQFIMSENRLKKAFMWVNRNLNTGEAVMLTSVLYSIFCLLWVVYIFRRSAFVSGLYRRASILSPGRFLGLTRDQDLLVAVLVAALLMTGSGLSTWQKLSAEKRQDRAVVIEPEAAVFSAPAEDSTLQFKIHEGTQMTVHSRRPGWVQIDLPGDLAGWVMQDAVEEI